MRSGDGGCLGRSHGYVVGLGEEGGVWWLGVLRVEPGAAVGGDAGWVVRLVGWLGLVGGRAVTSCWRLERGRVGGGWDGWRSGRCNRRVGLAEQVARGIRVCMGQIYLIKKRCPPC